MSSVPVPEDPSQPPGLFIVRRQGLRIPTGGLTFSINDDGTISGSLNRIEFSLDMCALWLRVAMDQLEDSMAAQTAAIEASRAGDDQELGKHLEAECTAGMLAICSAAFGLDAIYAALKDRSPRVAGIPTSMTKRRSARFKIVAEALRREFRIGPKGIMQVHNILKEVYRFRDQAVHPKGAFALPVLKAEINKVTEWRFVSFGAPSARTAVRATVALLAQGVERPRNANAEVAAYLKGLTPELQTLAARWRATYGLLTDEA
jgi:hypothetical protein